MKNKEIDISSPVNSYLFKNKFLHKNSIVIPISKGIINNTYLISSGNNKYIVKLERKEKIGQTISLKKQTDLIIYLSNHEITPKLISFNEELSILMLEYKENFFRKPKLEMSKVKNIEKVIHILKKLHKLEFNLPELKLTKVAKNYIKNIGGIDKLDQEKKQWSEYMFSLADIFDKKFEPNSLCHNDLIPENIIYNRSIWLVDFEFSVISDPVLDLAGLAAMNNYNTKQIEFLLGSYYGRKIPYPIKLFKDLILLLKLITYFWGLSYSVNIKSIIQPSFASHMKKMIK